MTPIRLRRWHCFTNFLAFFLIIFYDLCTSVAVAAKEELSCSATEEQVQGSPDPNLREMEYDIGYGKQTFMAYVEPDITEFYRDTPLPSSKKVVPKFDGLATKFVNMAKHPVHLYWEPYEGGELADMGLLEAFGATGSASHPGHRFVFCTPNTNPPEILDRVFIVEHPQNTYVYDPYFVEGDPVKTAENLDRELTTYEERLDYQRWEDTLHFSDVYLNFTGRSYIANYLRAPPRHWMWSADYFGQTHWTETKETHFIQNPPASEIGAVKERGHERILSDTDPRLLSEYRDPTQSTLNMTLKVLSCAPRVFEVENFLSPLEVAHILQVAGGVKLGRSSVGDIGPGSENQEIVESSVADTRTSLNSWLPRESSPIFDAIYRRAADLMRIDEALLRNRGDEERPEWPTKKSIAESLQLVHYSDGQKYTAHHDFGFSDLGEDEDSSDPQSGFAQGTRFATLLLYLNSEGLEGGETTFPRWANAETFDQLRVKPVEGKAVLFYSQLSDGNLDDFSQHAALHPRKGEKWLVNLWVWDPMYEK